MLKKKYLYAAALCAAAGLAQAAPPSQASAEKLFEVQEFEKMMDDMSQSTVDTILNSEQMQRDLAAIPPAKRNKVQKIVARYVNADMQRLNTPEFRAKIRSLSVDSMRKIYTQEEVDAMIAFYGSPIGRSINAKIPQFFQTVMPPMADMLYEHAKQAPQHRSEMQREINQVLCGKNTCPPAKTKYK